MVIAACMRREWCEGCPREREALIAHKHGSAALGKSALGTEPSAAIRRLRNIRHVVRNGLAWISAVAHAPQDVVLDDLHTALAAQPVSFRVSMLC